MGNTQPNLTYAVYRQTAGKLRFVGMVLAFTGEEAVESAKAQYGLVAPVVELSKDDR